MEELRIDHVCVQSRDPFFILVSIQYLVLSGTQQLLHSCVVQTNDGTSELQYGQLHGSMITQSVKPDAVPRTVFPEECSLLNFRRFSASLFLPLFPHQFIYLPICLFTVLLISLVLSLSDHVCVPPLLVQLMFPLLYVSLLLLLQ